MRYFLYSGSESGLLTVWKPNTLLGIGGPVKFWHLATVVAISTETPEWSVPHSEVPCENRTIHPMQNITVLFALALVGLAMSALIFAIKALVGLIRERTKVTRRS